MQNTREEGMRALGDRIGGRQRKQILVRMESSHLRGPLRVRGPVFEETIEDRPIATSAASPGEPAVKVLGVGYGGGERG